MHQLQFEIVSDWNYSLLQSQYFGTSKFQYGTNIFELPCFRRHIQQYQCTDFRCKQSNFVMLFSFFFKFSLLLNFDLFFNFEFSENLDFFEKN